jgi:tetratricopeptide (TPR) repeat protein
MRSWMLGMCVLLASTPSVADDKAKAKQLYDEGLRHYQLAEYTQAIDAWKQAYMISKKPLLLFNIGQAYRLSGDCTHAMTFYENYTDAAANPTNQDELDQAVAACKNAKPPANDTNPTTITTTDTKPVEPKPVETKPVETPVKAEPPPPSPLPAPAATGGHRRLGLFIGVGGVVLEGGAVFFALQSKSKADDVQNYVMQSNVFDAHAKSLESDGQRDNKLAWGFGIAGGAAIIAGAVLYLTGGSSEEHGVAIVPTPDGARVGWSTTF